MLTAIQGVLLARTLPQLEVDNHISHAVVGILNPPQTSRTAETSKALQTLVGGQAFGSKIAVVHRTLPIGVVIVVVVEAEVVVRNACEPKRSSHETVRCLLWYGAYIDSRWRDQLGVDG
jgi:hypothetical protein